MAGLVRKDAKGPSLPPQKLSPPIVCPVMSRAIHPIPSHPIPPEKPVVFFFLSACPLSPRPLAAEQLGINITAECFTQEGESGFGPVERSEIPELQDGLHVFGICARVEVGTESWCRSGRVSRLERWFRTAN